MPRTQLLVDARIIRPTESALALKLVSEMQLLRLKAIARLHARGLPPDVTWDDLLQEALTRVLTGSRKKPRGVPVAAFLAGVMRSLKSEHWRRAAGTSAGTRTPRDLQLRDAAPDPERSLIAMEELGAIERLFADDPMVLQIIAGLGEGHSAEQIRVSMGLSKTDYDSARRRMRRRLLQEGLTCAAK